MVDIQTTAGIIDLSVKVLTIIFLIIASSMAIKKKKNLALAIAIIGNLAVFYFTQSPLLCWIVSIAVIIWVGVSKNAEVKETNETSNSKSNKQSLKTSSSSTNNKKMVKSGPIIGLIIGILMAGFPIVGFMIGEASLSDPQGKMMGYGFIIFGAFMVIVNIIVLVTGKQNLLASEKNSSASSEDSPVKLIHVVPEDDSSAKFQKDKIRCRFCKKLYSAEYNGCPYCKKK